MLTHVPPPRHGRACPGHQSRQSAGCDGRDKPGHEGLGSVQMSQRSVTVWGETP